MERKLTMGDSTVPTISAGQMKDLGAAMIEAIPTNLPFSLAQQIIGKKGELGGRIRNMLETFDDGKIQWLSFPVTVDSSQKLQQMIGAYPYEYIDSDITSEHFPVRRQGKRQIEITLFHFFKRTISSDDAIAEMAREGFRPAEPEKVINLSAQHPGQDLQKELPIVALGSPWQDPRGHRRVVCLGGGDAGRDLRLPWFEGGWAEHWRFAAVRK